MRLLDLNRASRAGFSLALSLGLCLAVAACSDANSGKTTSAVDPSKALGLKPGQLNSFKFIETTLSADTTIAGQAVTVTCTAQPGNVVIPIPTYTVLPSSGVQVSGGSLTPTKTGSYQVACTLTAVKVIDPSPASLIVNPGPATSITTSVSPASIPAGDLSTITCTGKDSYGNDVGKTTTGTWSASISPAETAEITDLQAAGRKVGKGEVRCALSDSPDAQVTAATLEVTAGKADKTIALVSPSAIEAGAGSADVGCSAQDAYGNDVTVAAADFTVDAPADLTVAGTKVSGTKSGKFEVKCKLAGAANQVAAKLEVKPGAPISMELVASPKQPIYKVDDTVKISGLGKDKFGNDVPDMELNQPVAIDMPEGVTVNAGGKSYSFSQDGYYTFTGTSKDFPAMSASIKLKVDSTGPLMLITEPKRGETRKGDAKVTVKGTCIDELSALKSLTINTQKVTVAGDGSFTFDIDSQQGMNAIVWVATDEWDNVSNGVQSYYYSTKWYEVDPAKVDLASIPSAIGVWLSQTILDSGIHDHKKPKDLATVAEIIIGTIDIGSLLGAGGLPIKQAGVFDGSLQFQNVSMGDKAVNDGYPQMSLTVIKGGMHAAIKISKFSIDLLLDGTAIGFLPIKQLVTIKADSILIELDLLITVDPVTGQTSSTAKNLKFNITNLQPLLPGIAGQLLNPILSLVTNTIMPLLTTLLQGQIQTMLSDTLNSALSQLAINTDLPIPALLGTGPGVKLHLASKLGLLTFRPVTPDPPAGIIAGLNGSMTSAKGVPHDVLGSIGRAGCLDPKQTEVFNPSLKYGLEAGLADDFVNELLYSIWYGGLLQMNIGASALGSVDLSSFGVSDLSVETDFMLPPILDTCLDNTGLLKLQIGDLGIHAKLNMSGTPIDIYMYASMQATAELKAVPNATTGESELGFSLKGIDFLEMEITKINAEAKGMKDLFVTLIKNVLLPKLTGSLGSGLGSFPLPAIDLSTLSPQIPAGTKIALSIQQIENQKGYTYLRGTLK